MLHNIMNYLTAQAEIPNGLLLLLYYYFLYFFFKFLQNSDIGKAFIEGLKDDEDI